MKKVSREPIMPIPSKKLRRSYEELVAEIDRITELNEKEMEARSFQLYKALKEDLDQLNPNSDK